ncbi:MAG: AAA family ATPase [Acidimicrobiales bacterium]|nr:AAA family ATPase [Acidimicrobiales bacterium]
MDEGRHAALRGVLFSDVVDSTGLRQRLGDDRADALRRDHNALVGSAVAAHGGRVLRWTGDGVKADFATASAALAAAIEMQRGVAAYGERPGAVSPFQIRIGVSVGEVVIEGNEAHGIAAIEAARLEPMAAPGEILATALVQRLGQRRTDAQFEDVGSFVLKGLDEPVTVVRVVDVLPAALRPLPPAVTVDRRFPLVGRSDELARAMTRWQECRSGAAATVVVAGSPGLGKSRLVAQVADRAHGDGALVLAGGCDSDLALPYHPFAAAFGEAASVDEELAGAVADGAGPLGRLFPSRRPAGLDDAAPSARFELFEAVADLVDRLARAQPVVLVVDDLQWADQPSIQLLRHLLGRTRHDALLVLATVRPDEVAPDHPLAELLAELRTHPSATTVSLTPLHRADISDLVAARVPFAPTPHVVALAARLLEESGGSPFFTCELLEHFSATGELERLVEEGAAADLPIPDSVRAVVVQRLARLPAAASELLEIAAVIGMSFDLTLLAEVTGRPEHEVLEVSEEVARLDLLREVGIARFAFAHAIVRATLFDSLSASRRALTHRRVAEAIVHLGRQDHDELAHHWREAGVADRADESLERAARRDLEALAYESARDRYQYLVEAHGSAPAQDAAALARALLGRGLARRALAESGYLADVEQAARLGRRLGDVDIVAEAAIASVWPGTFFHIAGEVPAELVELCEDALGLLPADDRRRVLVLATLASHLSFDPDRPRRVALLAEADERARRIGDPELIGSVLVAEHLALWDPTTFERRQEIAVEVGRMARASGSVELEFFGAFFAAIGATERGWLAKARDLLEGLGEVVTASQNPYFAFLVERLLLSLEITACGAEVQGKVDDLVSRYEATHADTAGTWAIQTGMLALQQGTFGALVPTLRTMIETRSRVGTNWAAPLGLALVATGDIEEAAGVLEALDSPPLDYFWLTTVQIVAELAVGVGDEVWQQRCIDELSPFRDRLGITASGSLCYGLVATNLGQLALARGRVDEAVDLLREAAARAHNMGAPFESVRARRLLAAALLADGQRAEAGGLILEAGADARAHGFEGEAALLAALAGGG